MKHFFLIFLVFFCAVLSGSSGKEKDPFSEFDTRRPVQERELAAPAGENLFQCRFDSDTMTGKNAWKKTKHVFSMKKLSPSFSGRILKSVHFKAEKDFVHLSIGKEAVSFPVEGRKNKFYEVECGVVKTFPLRPDMAGRELRVEFQYTGIGPMQLFITFPGKGVFRSFDHDNKGVLKKSVIIPAGADKVIVNCWLRGVGNIRLSSASGTVCVPDKEEKKADARVYLNSFMEEDFLLPDKGYSFPVFWVIRPPEKRKYTNIQLHVKLPEGYEFTGEDNKMPLLSRKGNLYIFDLSYYATFAGTISPGKYCVWVYPCTMLRSVKGAGASGIMESKVVENGVSSIPRRLLLKTVPFEKGVMPKDFWYGYCQTRGGNLDAKAAKALVKLLKDSGFNHMAAQNDKSDALNTEFIRNGFELFNCAPSIRDGYFMVFAPPEAQFLDYDQKPYKHYVCPEEIGNRGKFYQQLEKKLIEPTVKNRTNHWMVNWEPYPTDYRGCFCMRCRKAFAAYAKLDAGMICALPGKEIMKKYHDPWVRFRSLQHGKVIKRLEESISSLAAKYGKKCHFMPEVSYECFYAGSKYSNQYRPEDYLKYLKEINIWGPYIYKGGIWEPYRYRTGANLLFYVAAKGIMDFVAKNCGKKEVPKVMFMPWSMRHTSRHGLRGFNFDNVCAFLAGGRGSCLYGGFINDYRAWRLSSAASRLLAAFEEMRLWEKRENFTAKVITPSIREEHWKLVTEKNIEAYPLIGKIKSPLLLESREKDGRFWVAAGNFWEMGKVYFRLKAKSLSKGEWVISLPHERRFMRVDGESLRKGIVLALEPLSWNFFLVEKIAAGKDYGKEFTQKDVLNNLKKDLPAIRRALAYEDKLLGDYKRMTHVEDYDFGAVPEITGGTVTAKEKKTAQGQKVAISASSYQAVLDPAAGGKISSFVIRGTELVHTQRKGNISASAFWMPVRGKFQKPCRIMKIQPERSGVQIILEREEEEICLKIRQEYLFTEEKIVHKVKITNMDKSPQSVAYRSHNFIVLAGRGATLTGENGFSLKLEPGSRVYSIRGCDKTGFEESLRGIEIKSSLKGNTFSLQNPDYPVSLTFRTSSPLFGIFAWIPEKKEEKGTFEPTFMPVKGKLKPGESCSFVSEWQWKWHNTGKNK